MSKRSSFIGLGAFLMLLFSGFGEVQAISETQLVCGFEADSTWEVELGSFKKTDTLKGVAIYGCTAIPPQGTTRLPVFWRDVWDSTKSLSVPRFYRENSDRKYILNVDPFGAPDSFCFVSNLVPTGNSGGDAYTRDILTQADAYINFANYDRDGDKFIEDGIVICIAYDTAHLGAPILGLTGGGALDTFVTNDLVGGIPIKIVAGSGVTLRVPTRRFGVRHWIAAYEKMYEMVMYR